ncbi:hypothetical protein QFC19_001391 [Naganishia cerealis]|uniref:Uncharacterized protein n=1 Tax=Naganishia cerealis TaxID=610337 RepID=A0ACC2WK03_9TREE|nr:hypothetical protein QFC19_001391 [Naganishia cerealis]
MESAPIQALPALPFPAVDYFAYIAWDIMHGKIDSAFQSPLAMSTNPPTPPPQAPTLQPEPAFRDYLQRLITTTAVSQSVVIVALFYLYKARARLQPQLIISDIVDKRYGYSLCAASLMLANKFLDDNTYTSRTWATLSGYTLWEVNDCERGLLSALDFQLNISLTEYHDWWRFLTMYGPSFTYPHTPALFAPQLSRPSTAEMQLPLMKAATRRNPRIEVLSRPGSRKRTFADCDAESPNKRASLVGHTYERSVPNPHLVTYQPQEHSAIPQQPYVPSAMHAAQQLSSANPFAFDWSAIIQDYPLGYYKLVASPADPRGDDHYRKAQLVQVPLRQSSVSRPCIPSLLHPSGPYPTSARPLSAPIQSRQPSGALVAFPNQMDDYISYYDTGSVYSQQTSSVEARQQEAIARNGAALASQQSISVYPNNTVDVTQLDGYLNAN